MRTVSPALRRPPSAQRGSAYLIVLLVLVVLTIVGLSLVLITQTEMQIGANERVTNRVFYAADAGVQIATVRAMFHDYTPTSFVLRDSSGIGALNAGERVELSPFYAILWGACNLCTINQGQNLLDVNHALTVRATRLGWTGAEPTEDSPQQAQKTIAVMMELQPWELTPEALEALANGTEDIKY
jgi:hypothetical protein